MDLFVIVLNWNAAEDTIRCVQSVADWQRVQPIIWVVDNDSHDDSIEQIRRHCPAVRLIQNETNMGFSGGSNRGMAAALAEGDAPILLLNNDASIDEGDVMRLEQTLRENGDLGFVVPLLYGAETGRMISAGGKNPIKHMQTRLLELPDGVSVVETEVVSGTAVLIRSETLRQVGLLDERFFSSTEVADLCLRAKKVGYGCAADRRARASHSVDRSSHLRNTLYVYYIMRNRFLILRNHYRYNVFWFLFWVSYSAALAVKLLLAGEWQSARASLLALGDGVRGRFGNQNGRVLRKGS